MLKPLFNQLREARQVVECAVNRIAVDSGSRPRHDLEVHVRAIAIVLALSSVARITAVSVEQVGKPAQSVPGPNEAPPLFGFIEVVEEAELAPLSTRVGVCGFRGTHDQDTPSVQLTIYSTAKYPPGKHSENSGVSSGILGNNIKNVLNKNKCLSMGRKR